MTKHAEILAGLLPPVAYDPQAPNLARDLAAEGNALDAAEALLNQLASEIDPRNALLLLEDYEAWAGLPEDCGGASPVTLAERRAALFEKLTRKGSATLQWYIDFAALLGYTITIDTFTPFRTGVSRCGQRLQGGSDVRSVWRVNVPAARITEFRTGVSRCGDPLGRIARAEDLECQFDALMPAHVTLIFNYSGV